MGVSELRFRALVLILWAGMAINPKNPYSNLADTPLKGSFMSWIFWIQRNAVFVQAFATLVLVVVTFVYVYKTSRIAKASGETADATRELAKSTEESAKATGELAALTRDTMVANARPLVVLEYHDVGRLCSGGKPHEFVALVNVGFGPALDVVYKIVCPKGSEKTVVEKVKILMEQNSGYTLGIAPDNVVELVFMELNFVTYSIGFVVEYGDVYGNLYRTKYVGRRTAVEHISERILPFPPHSRT